MYDDNFAEEMNKTMRFKRAVEAEGIDVHYISKNEMNEKFGDNAGYRLGNNIYVCDYFDPVTARAIIGHEYNEGDKPHKKVQKETEELFREIGDYPALKRTKKIGTNLGEKNGYALGSKDIEKNNCSQWTADNLDDNGYWKTGMDNGIPDNYWFIHPRDFFRNELKKFLNNTGLDINLEKNARKKRDMAFTYTPLARKNDQWLKKLVEGETKKEDASVK